MTITHELPQGVDKAQSMSAVVDIRPAGKEVIDRGQAPLTQKQFRIIIDGVKSDGGVVPIVFSPASERAKEKLVFFSSDALEHAGFKRDQNDSFVLRWNDLERAGMQPRSILREFVTDDTVKELVMHFSRRLFERDHLYMIEEMINQASLGMSSADFLNLLQSVNVQYIDSGAEKHVFLVNFILSTGNAVKFVIALRVGRKDNMALRRQNDLFYVLWNTGIVPKVSKYNGRIGYMEYIPGEMLSDFLEKGRLTDQQIDEAVGSLIRLGHVMTGFEADRNYLFVDSVEIDFSLFDPDFDPGNKAASYIHLGLAELDDRPNTNGKQFVRLLPRFWTEGKRILGEKNWKKVLRGLYSDHFFDDTHEDNIIFRGSKAVVVDGLSDERFVSKDFLKYLIKMFDPKGSANIKRREQEKALHYFIRHMGPDKAWAAMFDILTGMDNLRLKDDLKRVIGEYYSMGSIPMDAYLLVVIMRGIQEEILSAKSIRQVQDKGLFGFSEAYEQLMGRFLNLDDTDRRQAVKEILRQWVRNDVLDTPELMEAAGQLRKAAEMMSRVVEFDENNTLVHPWQSFGLAFKAGVFDAGQGVSTDVMGEDVGGIDLHTIDKSLEPVQKEESSFRLFNIDPALQEQYRSASGVSAVVLRVSPHVSVSDFLTFP